MNNSDSQQQVTVNGDTSGWNPTTQDEITMAMIQNGGLKRIENAMRQRLDADGWTQNLREYCTKLFRSGEAKTYDDALAIVMQHIRMEGVEPEHAATNGNGAGVPAPNLIITREAAEGGAAVVRKELDKVVKHMPK